ncbi:glycoside hydrolase family 16 protein [Pseudonocardia benzenivorans]|uniref:Glycoside hydrolase family 16 protein n=1 Tax=Pseudonocardia benzenivorans TaxID=228005 RepID=A0ABW3VRE6_9PSEU
MVIPFGELVRGATTSAVAAVIALCAELVGAGPVAAADTPPPAYTFVDEFDGPAGSAPDPARWTYDLGAGGWGNGELQTYTDSRRNSFLDGAGNLVVRATATRAADGRIAYQSARLTTKGRFAQRYGHWEARLKFVSTRGYWPAWWTLGADIDRVGWPRCGEIDMFEDYGFGARESSVHTGTTDADLASWSASAPNDGRFHDVRMDWSPVGITFVLDGVPYGSVVFDPADPTRPADPGAAFMLLNVAVGGRVGAPDPAWTAPVDLVVDHVRVWS